MLFRVTVRWLMLPLMPDTEIGEGYKAARPTAGGPTSMEFGVVIGVVLLKVAATADCQPKQDAAVQSAEAQRPCLKRFIECMFFIESV